ncbi:ABC transporter [Thiospirochaeta perfilievii]|uniref:ABC transporter n=1 Tax=Thiospirochaeta perfilievii TaxID=252967 RepID=A0A5C1QEM9_9SPIO|nr:ABC transporter permease subunit [Thiospirochaeta perfilievii]QEN04682.1 ABC transporter [Thiospirochaeta perfilievii]
MSRKSVLSIAKKEFKSFFVTPVGYIVIGLYLVVSGWFLFSTIFLSKSVTLRDFFSLMPMILSFIIPALTMKSFSEEYKTGSYEMLGTQPITTMDITIGKVLATWAFVIVMLLPTLSYPLFLSTLGDLDNGVVLSGYIGAFLLSGSFTAIGTLASTLTKNQIIAFLIGAVICFVLTIIEGMVILLPKTVAGFIQYLSVGYHFKNISKGIIDSRDLIYFSSLIFLSILATGRRVNK